MRIITGRPSFLDITAGSADSAYAEPFEPKPPPQYSATTTRSSGGMPMNSASLATMKVWLWVDTCAMHLPFCQ